MVEARPQEEGEQMGVDEQPPLDYDLENMQKLMNDPKYMETAEMEIEKMLVNAKVALTQLGYDLDSERFKHIDEERKELVDETSEWDRLLAGGLSFCRQQKECGHRCAGVKDEDECLPCLEPDCIEGTNLPFSEELCNICFTCELKEEPSVQLGCGHVFHANCVIELLKHKWTSLRITFAFMSCPACKAPIQADHVDEILDEVNQLVDLRSSLQVKAMKIAKSQGLDRDERVTTEGDFFFNKPLQYAEAKVCFYMCAKCAKPYFGGLIDCEQEMGREDTTRREDLLCRPCLMKEMSIGSNICKKGHEAQYIDWKCMYCCSVALFNCGGTRWYCNRCHNEGHPKLRDCNGKNCPLKIHHPPAGYDVKKSGFPLGCSLCRSEHLLEYDAAQDEIRKLINEEDGALVMADIDRMPHASLKLPVGRGKKKKGPAKKMPLTAAQKAKKAKAARERREALERMQQGKLATGERAKAKQVAAAASKKR